MKRTFEELTGINLKDFTQNNKTIQYIEEYSSHRGDIIREVNKGNIQYLKDFISRVEYQKQ